MGFSKGPRTKEHQENLTAAIRKQRQDPEFIKRMSLASKITWNDPEYRERQSNAHKGIQAGENHPLFGKHHSEATRKKMRDSAKGHPAWSKGKTGIYSEETILKMRSIKLGKKQSAETIQRRTEKCRGQKRSIETREKIGNVHRGKILSIETRAKISASKVGKYGGENSPTWNPNLTDEQRHETRCYPEYRNWYLAIFGRAQFTCQLCGDDTGGNLNAHHYEAYKSNQGKRLSEENGITLCRECHWKFHRQYGFGKNTKEQFNEFMRAA